MSAPCPKGTVAVEHWSGAGNDFFLVAHDDIAGLGIDPAQLAQRIGPRGSPTGVDGLIVHRGAEANLWNRDGSPAAFCGNGARCLAARLLALGSQARVALRFGRFALVGWRDGSGYSVTLPTPRILQRDIPFETITAALGELKGSVIDVAWIEAGVAHLCLRCGSRSAAEGGIGPDSRSALEAIGSRLRHHVLFRPHGTNVDFFWVSAGHEEDARIPLRTFERGVEGLTLACGSGALAAAALLLMDRAAGEASWNVASGAELKVTKKAGSAWVLSGPAEQIGAGCLEVPA